MNRHKIYGVIVSLLALVVWLSVANAQSKDRGALSNLTALNKDNDQHTKDNYASQMTELYKSIVGCEDSKPCKEMDLKSLSSWLKNTSDRDPSRIGNSNLNFADFFALRAKYGNAWAKMHELHSRWLPETARSFAYYDGDEDDLIVAEKDYDTTDLFDKSEKLRLEAAIADYAEDMIAIMDKSGDGNGTVSLIEFVNHLIKKRI